MNYHQEITRYLPAQATAATFIPILVLVFNKLSMRKTVHKQRDLREKVIALNVFVGSMNAFTDPGEHHAACLRDALRQRDLMLVQLAALTRRENRTSPRLASFSVDRPKMAELPSSP